MNKNEFEEVLKIHIVGGYPITKIEKTYGLCKNATGRWMRSLGVASNKKCFKVVDKTKKYCGSCKKILPLNNFSKNTHMCKWCSQKYKPYYDDKGKYKQYVWYINYRYGINEEGLRSLMDKQRGGCAICGASLINPNYSMHDMHIDHDHITGEVRGLLCKGCNLGLGDFNDDPIRLEKGANYIRSHNAL